MIEVLAYIVGTVTFIMGMMGVTVPVLWFIGYGITLLGAFLSLLFLAVSEGK